MLRGGGAAGSAAELEVGLRLFIAWLSVISWSVTLIHLRTMHSFTLRCLLCRSLETGGSAVVSYYRKGAKDAAHLISESPELCDL